MPIVNKEPENKTRLLAKVLWPLVVSGDYTTLADLTDALKCQCARLHITWTDDDINAAYRLIESNTALIPPSPLLHRLLTEQLPPPIDQNADRAFSTKFLAKLRARSDKGRKTPPNDPARPEHFPDLVPT